MQKMLSYLSMTTNIEQQNSVTILLKFSRLYANTNLIIALEKIAYKQ